MVRGSKGEMQRQDTNQAGYDQGFVDNAFSYPMIFFSCIGLKRDIYFLLLKDREKT